MKVAVLTCEMLEDKLLKSSAASSLVPILAEARKVRDSGMFKGEPVRAGLVQASWQAAPIMKFRCVHASPVSKPKRGRKESV